MADEVPEAPKKQLSGMENITGGLKSALGLFGGGQSEPTRFMSFQPGKKKPAAAAAPPPAEPPKPAAPSVPVSTAAAPPPEAPTKQLSGMENTGGGLKIPSLFGQAEPTRFQSFPVGKKPAVSQSFAPGSAAKKPAVSQSFAPGKAAAPERPAVPKVPIKLIPERKEEEEVEDEVSTVGALFNCIRCVDREGKGIKHTGPVPPWRQGSGATLPGAAPSFARRRRASVSGKAPPPPKPKVPTEAPADAAALIKQLSRENSLTSAELSAGEKSRHKGEDEAERIRAALLHDEARLSTLLDGLTETQMQAMVSSAERRLCAVGEEVVTQGDGGERLYVVDTGKYVVEKDGKLLDKAYVAGDCFGELALMFQAPRAATVRCAVAGTVWALSGAEFRQTLASSAAKTLEQRAAFLGTTSVFSRLTDAQRMHLSDKFEEVRFVDGEKVCKLGDPADSLFILLAGVVSCRKEDGSEDVVLEPGAVFGESSIEKLDGVRQRDVVAVAESVPVVTCLRLSAQVFREQLGDLTTIVAENFKRRVLEGVEIDGVRLFDKIGKKQQELLLSSLVEREFEAGSHVIQQGMINDTFYVIKSGVARVLQSKKITPTASPRVTEVAQLSAGDFFGERALLTQEAAGATVKVWILPSRKPLTCYCLDRDKFTELLGSLQTLLMNVVEDHDHGPTVEFASLKMRGVLDLAVGTVGRYKLVTHMKEKRISRTTGAGPAGRPFLLKCVRKAQVADEPAKVLEEKRLLTMCKDHPFVLHLNGTFQDAGEVYFLRDVGLGGDLKSLLTKTVHDDESAVLEDDAAMFYAGCVIAALHHLHDMSICYRDLKPENLLLDELGYPKLCDFGLAKELPNGAKTFTLCGTPEYMSPEVVKHKGQSFPSDWWSLGVLTFELFTGKTPFEDDDPFQVTVKILRAKGMAWPRYLDHRITHGADFIDNLLQVEQHKRLGSKCCLSPGGHATNSFNGSREVRQHMWFNENQFDFMSIEAKEFPAPFLPKGAVVYEPANMLITESDPQLMLYPNELPELLVDFGEAVNA